MPGVVSFSTLGPFVIVRINAGGRRGERPQDDSTRSEATQDAAAPEHRVVEGSLSTEGEALPRLRVRF